MAASESDPDHDGRDDEALADVERDEILVEQTPASSTAVANLKASRLGDDLLDSRAGPWSDTAGVMQRLITTVKRSENQFDVSPRDIDIMTSQVDALISILTDLIPKASLDLGPADDVYGYRDSSRLRHRRSSPGPLGSYPYTRHGNGMYDTPGKYPYGFGDTAVAQPGASKDDKPKHKTRPVLNHMDWTEWEASRWPARPKDDYAAIDILCEEPRPWSTGQYRFVNAAKEYGAGTVAPSAIGGDAQVNGDGITANVKPLPPRIRINSSAVVQLLVDAICEEMYSIDDESKPLVISRPYKVLTVKEQEIRDLLAEQEKSLADRTSSEPPSGEAEDSQLAGDDATDAADPMDPALPASAIPDVTIPNRSDWSAFSLTELKRAVDDLKVLVEFIDDYLNPVRNFLASDATAVSYGDLWHLFQPGTLVYLRDSSVPQKVYRVIQANGGRPYYHDLDAYPSGPRYEERVRRDPLYSTFVIDCHCLDFDGTEFVQVQKTVWIETFDGLAPISTLPAMPLAMAGQQYFIDINEIRQRGAEFLAYTKVRHRYYQGFTVSQRPEGGWLYRKGDGYFGTTTRVYSARVESQVVVDFQRGIEAQTDWGPTRADNQLREPISGELLDGTEQMERDHLWDKRCSDDLMATERKKWARWNKGEENPDGDDLLLLPERVIAYILRSRTWACLRLGKDDRGKAYLIEIEEQQDAWTDLEIPTGHKNIVQSLIQSHSVKNKSKETHFDIVRDKGKGVILLLHGVPGVGKTATAECVAASTGKPLLPITCGDLGLTPKEVETTLENAFQLAQAWDCVLLLDEADIFLAQRTNQDIERNALVSVFLRALEYYEGILFLTTNRVGAIDEAFKSRIHVQLYYSSLTWPVTEKIWRQHIRRAQEGLLKIECDVNELLFYAHELFDKQVGSHDKMAWNGRQLRNAFQSAIAMARSGLQPNDPIKVEKRHFETVADVSREFNDYIWRTNSGRSDADIAKELGARYDGYDAAARRASVQPQYPQFPPPPASAPMAYRQAPPPGPTYQQHGAPHMAQQQPVYFSGAPYNAMPPAQYSNQITAQPFAYPSGQPMQQQPQPAPNYPYPANTTQLQQTQQPPHAQYPPQQQPGMPTNAPPQVANSAMQPPTPTPLQPQQAPNTQPQQAAYPAHPMYGAYPMTGGAEQQQQPPQQYQQPLQQPQQPQKPQQ
ncbi:hypothetical protein LTR95_003425 [Oleoguttula sp. CCFEE 5521]